MGIFSLFKTSAEKQNFNQILGSLNHVEISLSSDSTKKKNTRKLNLKITNLTKTTSLKKLKNGFIARAIQIRLNEFMDFQQGWFYV